MKRLHYYKLDFIRLFFFFTLFVALFFFFFTASGVPNQKPGYPKLYIADSTAFEELGEALFSDSRFSSPDGKFSGLKKDEFLQFKISCKSCHLVDEKLNEKGIRGYTDFQNRTPVPYREGDSEPYQFTHRRTQQMINVAGNNISSSPVYHWDGEFNTGNEHTSLIKLIERTFVSRNMGWRPGEEETSNTLRLKFILEDAGVAAGTNGEGRLSYIEQYCLSLGLTKDGFFKFSGEEILSICNEAIALYIENIKSDVESSFDLFLIENGIANPREADEPVLKELFIRDDIKFINKTIPILNSEIASSRKVKFGKKELRGLKLFMDKQKTNCSSCHTPPSFTNNKFYNIGVSEFDYKDIHKKFPGDFYEAKKINHVLSAGNINDLRQIYQVYPYKGNPEVIDLGNGLFTGSEKNFGAFRVPTLRNLKYCNPYLHSGRAETIYDVIQHHIAASQDKQRLKFVSTELISITLNKEEIHDLTAFIYSLNDHYE